MLSEKSPTGKADTTIKLLEIAEKADVALEIITKVVSEQAKELGANMKILTGSLFFTPRYGPAGFVRVGDDTWRPAALHKAMRYAQRHEARSPDRGVWTGRKPQITRRKQNGRKI